MNRTLEYYEKNAHNFAEGTAKVKFTSVQDRFLACLPKDGRILDFGCGSGRDTKYFLSRGFKVDAVDGSAKICEIAENNTGIKVRQMDFTELDVQEKYDGIWACASVLHLPKEELTVVFRKMLQALKLRGYLYASFKYGVFEGWRNERYYTNFTEKSFREFVGMFPEAEIIEEWISSDVRPGREDEKWLNLILNKTGTA